MDEDDEDYSLTQEEFERWYTPREALQLLDPHLNRVQSKPLILKRIGDQELFTAARKICVTSNHREAEPRFYERISKKRWATNPRELISHVVWDTNDIVFTIPGATMAAPTTTISCVEVRFEPKGVLALVRSLQPRPTPAQLAEAIRTVPASEPNAAAPKESFPHLSKHLGAGDKPVPEAALKRWYTAWVELYPAHLQNNDTGLDHARATFPTNKVTRDRVRGLRDAKKPGPKKGTAE